MHMKQQRGGTILGFIIGVVVGLAAALAVAVYVTKVPVPFMNKGQSRSADQDEAEAKKNKDWDPNAPLYGKNPAKSAASAPVAPLVAGAASSTKGAEPAKVDPKASAKGDGKPEIKPAVSGDPLGDLVTAKSTQTATEPFLFFVKLGAFRTIEDAESQRAKLSLSGIETKITEREQSGRIVFRVRSGPFDSKEDAERNKEKLDKAGLETSLVRVQR
jgi:cell division protein FtsN